MAKKEAPNIGRSAILGALYGVRRTGRAVKTAGWYLLGWFPPGMRKMKRLGIFFNAEDLSFLDELRR